MNVPNMANIDPHKAPGPEEKETRVDWLKSAIKNKHIGIALALEIEERPREMINALELHCLTHKNSEIKPVDDPQYWASVRDKYARLHEDEKPTLIDSKKEIPIQEADTIPNESFDRQKLELANASTEEAEPEIDTKKYILKIKQLNRERNKLKTKLYLSILERALYQLETDDLITSSSREETLINCREDSEYLNLAYTRFGKKQPGGEKGLDYSQLLGSSTPSNVILDYISNDMGIPLEIKERRKEKKYKKIFKKIFRKEKDSKEESSHEYRAQAIPIQKEVIHTTSNKNLNRLRTIGLSSIVLIGSYLAGTSIYNTVNQFRTETTPIIEEIVTNQPNENLESRLEKLEPTPEQISQITPKPIPKVIPNTTPRPIQKPKHQKVKEVPKIRYNKKICSPVSKRCSNYVRIDNQTIVYSLPVLKGDTLSGINYDFAVSNVSNGNLMPDVKREYIRGTNGQKVIEENGALFYENGNKVKTKDTLEIRIPYNEVYKKQQGD